VSTPPTILCLASYYKGNRFMERAKQEGCQVFLLTIESLLGEPWPRAALDDVFALPDFHNREHLVKAVAYLSRTRGFDRIVALDDFDVETAAFLRDHFRIAGLNESHARLFRDKLAMRTRAKEIGMRIPEFVGLFNHARVSEFLQSVPAPWLIKPRSQASAAGIRRLSHPDDVWREIHKLGDEQSHFLLERMVPGDVFHVDSLVVNGKVVFAEANGYLRPLLEVYHDGGIYATRTLPRDHADVANLLSVNELVLTGFGLRNSASHTEFLKSHADGQFYFIETSARVGGAHTAEMVEAATGVNLWGEWAAIEAANIRGSQYTLPPRTERYGGVVMSLARYEHPDTSSFTDREIVYRANLKNHIGFVVQADQPTRVQELLHDYIGRIRHDFLAVLPAAERVSH
jgi:hypothetical protein